MKKRYLIMIALMLAAGFVSVDAKATVTIATFADPSGNSSDPLFTVDYISMQLAGGWSDAKNGLTLEVPYQSGGSYANAWFSMDSVTILNAVGDTSGGTVNFYADGTSTNPLVVITFGSGHVDSYAFGGNSIFVANNVTITGSAIAFPPPLSECMFAFSFANSDYIQGNPANGFTATAAFTSSAIPEPATICVLGLGALSLVRRKKVAA